MYEKYPISDNSNSIKKMHKFTPNLDNFCSIFVKYLYRRLKQFLYGCFFKFNKFGMSYDIRKSDKLMIILKYDSYFKQRHEIPFMIALINLIFHNHPDPKRPARLNAQAMRFEKSSF